MKRFAKALVSHAETGRITESLLPYDPGGLRLKKLTGRPEDAKMEFVKPNDIVAILKIG